MKISFVHIVGVFVIGKCFAAPLREQKDILFVPIRSYSYDASLPPPQLRGPFDFIGNWIQSSEWFPIEINVPDTFSNIGSGVSTFATNVGNGFNNFAQNVGSGFQTFSQNVGSGIQNFAQNLGERFPLLGVIYRPNAPARYFVLMPAKEVNVQMNNAPMMIADDELLESFP